MSDRQKRVLIVAFHYPPDLSSSGVLRTLKFSRYLPESGWLPTVLTVEPKHYETKDSALEAQIPPDVEVHRTRAIDMKRTFSIKGRHFRFTVVPDRFTGWIPFAVARGRKLIREKRIDAIFSTSPLATSHLVAMSLQRLTGLPWAADFRDPWLEPELADTKSSLYRFEESLYRRVVNRASRLVYTTSQLRDYALRGRETLAEKATVIPNGYDEDDFGATVEGTPDAAPITIAHTGLVDGSYRSPHMVFSALAHLIASGEVGAREVRVRFLGPGGYTQSAEFLKRLEDLKLREVVEATGKVSYRECLLEQSRSHILLLLQCGDDTRTLIPAKAFEYLRVGRPILAVTPEGATSELFAATGGAQVVHPQDENGMRAALRKLIADARGGVARPQINRPVLESYSRRNLSRRLADVLDGMCGVKADARMPEVPLPAAAETAR
jgi:glycosyltransferase involved in cell wall biosynthesis